MRRISETLKSSYSAGTSCTRLLAGVGQARARHAVVTERGPTI